MNDRTNESDESLIRAAQSGDAAAMEAMTVRHDALTKYVAKRYLGRGLEFDDLHQLGRLGLVKAIKNFNCEFSVKFSTYAVPVIMGEIRRYLRDDGQVHVTRSIRENAIKIKKLLDEQEGVMSVGDIAAKTGMQVEDVMLAIDSGRQVRSLSEPVTQDGSMALEDTIGEDSMPGVIERIELTRLLNLLSGQEKSLIVRRYFLEHTQSRIAQELGMTQVQVSRMESRILKRLRDMAV